ncbi:spore protease YyaC [Lentibacillus populi]|uniref:Spore protease YyaC n=1 Tax=Lentibacillus populi TaxID=1827502 RepID=A0A9W5TXE4_9BACI|nr:MULTISPECIES: spore protease YyaC [Bacillaceae]MBT2217241.1 spore protease YyaC [Virgibacillus dakarensis]GGB42988.1 spore protease YyaC [Lentibacillus populi]
MNLKKRFTVKNEVFKMAYTDPDLLEIMCEKLISWLPAIPQEYVVVCIGTDRSTGDALGPLIGTFFTELKPKHMSVYGTLNEPVHATNLASYVQLIKRKHHKPFIIAVDACLGKSNSVGSLITGIGSIKPGAALNKPLPPIGDIHITGVVNISGFMEYSILQNTRLSIVVEMAKKIAAILDQIDQRLTYGQTLPAVISPRNIAPSTADI